jgi:hypothetical protein
VALAPIQRLRTAQIPTTSDAEPSGHADCEPDRYAISHAHTAPGTDPYTHNSSQDFGCRATLQWHYHLQ